MGKFIVSCIFVIIGLSCGGGADAVPPGLRVKPSSLMTPITGFSTQRVQNDATALGPGCSGNLETGRGCASFRLSCSPSHMGYDDPILFQTPGTPNLSHLHLFWGSTTVNYNTDITVHPQTSGGNSTCLGGTANRSMYWSPTLVDTSTGNVVNPVGNVQVYYKNGQVPPNYINVIPANLRMITGNALATPANPYGFNFWICEQTGANAPNLHAHLNGVGINPPGAPLCQIGDTLIQNIDFGQCISETGGVPDVDSPNHKSHVTAGVSNTTTGCPVSHPYGIPLISIQIGYTITANTRYWRLVSDMYTGPGGYSAHTDFRMGWDDAIHRSWINGCLRQGKDCHSNLLGCRDENNNVITCRGLF